MRSDLPEISDTTIGDKLLITYAFTSFFPIAYLYIGKLENWVPMKKDSI